jgi:hypothetical protein
MFPSPFVVRNHNYFDNLRDILIAQKTNPIYQPKVASWAKSRRKAKKNKNTKKH